MSIVVKSCLGPLEVKCKGKCAATAGLAREPDAATMLANDLVTDVEAQSQTLNVRILLGPHPVEAVKKSGVVFLGDAGTLIAYPGHHLLCCDAPCLALDPHDHCCVWWTILEGIANEIVQHLLNPERITSSEDSFFAGLQHQPMLGCGLVLFHH